MYKAFLMLALAGCLVACGATQTTTTEATPTPTPTPQRTPQEEVAMAYTAAERAFSELNAHNRRGALDMLEIVETSLKNATTVTGADKLLKSAETVKAEVQNKNKDALDSLNKLVEDTKAAAQKIADSK